MVRLTPLQFAYLLRFRRAPSQGGPAAALAAGDQDQHLADQLQPDPMSYEIVVITPKVPVSARV
jgi:hypothetical protein